MQEQAVQQKRQKGKENASAADTATSAEPAAGDRAGASKSEETSPFACLHATMGWDTFHMVHVLWIGLVDTGGKPAEKDWELQVLGQASKHSATLLQMCLFISLHSIFALRDTFMHCLFGS